MTGNKQNDIAALERAIAKKYGKDAVKLPSSEWTPEKENKYREQIKEAHQKQKEVESESREVDGVSIKGRLIITDTKVCIVCEEYSVELYDDYYLTKYGVCKTCFIEHVEGREDEWEKHNGQ
jgi:hypothetical protein